MKRKRLIFTLCYSLLLGTLGVTSLSGCNSTLNDSKVIITGVKNGYVGDKITLSAIVTGDETNSVTWESLDTSVGTISATGEVTLLSPGTCRIQATSTLDSSKKSSYAYITCFETEGESYELEIISMPSKTKYKTNEVLDLTGLAVSGFTYRNGVKDNSTGVSFLNSELTFSIKEGDTLSTNGTIEVTISKDNYTSTKFAISVSETITQTKLYVYSAPTTTEYLLEEGSSGVAFNTSGLIISKVTYVDNVKKSETRINSSKYSLSMEKGELFTKEGNYEIQVTSNETDVEGTSFNVIVYTKDTSAYDIVKTLQNSKNFKIEVLNNVGTTKDTTGFHYVRTYTEDYYDEYEYQNETDSSGNITFNTTNIKSHTGYASYIDATTGTKGILSYTENELKDIEGGRIITTKASSWWDKATTLAYLFDDFDLSLIPTATMNGNYIITTIRQVKGDDEDGTKTLANYPLIESFLSYCGWSTSLITIMTRFEVKVEGASGLSMKAYFGSYGYTELKVLGIGNQTVSKVEKAIKEGLSPKTDIDYRVQNVANRLKGNNFTTYSYSSGMTSNATGYYTDTYYCNSSGSGYCLINNSIYSFSRVTKSNNEYEFKLGSKINTTSDLQTYVSSLSNVIKYPSVALKDMIGVGDNNTLNTFEYYDSWSTSTYAVYQSFDDTTKGIVEDFFGYTNENGRIWLYTHYEIEDNYDESNISAIELWNIAVTGGGGSGSVVCFGSYGTTSLSWVEEGILANTK